jgi:hypothetical protein
MHVSNKAVRTKRVRALLWLQFCCTWVIMVVRTCTVRVLLAHPVAWRRLQSAAQACHRFCRAGAYSDVAQCRRPAPPTGCSKFCTHSATRRHEAGVSVHYASGSICTCKARL